MGHVSMENLGQFCVEIHTEEIPRGMDFLFSLNRINVAVSRAKALVFGAPRLRKAKCETVEQMRLVNTLCSLSKAVKEDE